MNASLGVERTTRNRIAEGVVHRNVLGDSGDTGERLEGPRLAAATGGLRAFAFVGVVEAFERSMCLLARTAARDADAVCRSCCEKKGPRRALEALPKINAAADHDKHAERAAPRLSPPKKKRPRPQRPPP